ncbi:MAG: type I methionyl aminopeptidase, partial [Candidatus Vogelbacteria bacterium]|nr:type I methionyl aminopeptidase [Candidatus Vogelbacteria bacterium]
MIRLKTEKDIEILRAGGQRLAKILATVAKEVKVGIETRELDDLAEKLILAGGDKPAFKNYRPAGSRLAYPASLCVSVNEEIVHGIPSRRKIVDGDIVSLDLGLIHGGLYTDMALTVGVGQIGQEKQKMIEVAREALMMGIKSAKVGRYIGDISEAIENFVTRQGFSVVLDLAGHGVGFSAHEDPFIP